MERVWSRDRRVINAVQIQSERAGKVTLYKIWYELKL